MSLILLQDGFGNDKFFPADSELRIHCTSVSQGTRYIYLQYLDMPFGFRKISRNNVLSLAPHERKCIESRLEEIDQGLFDDDSKVQHLHHLLDTPPN
ncbi:hypothetical protein MUN89_19195 [Halobacillus salinarum]|uniref:Uncharacterized protein n=1 Tax=Halobacillus salinarum TaxID=2932257 RepID=A0ABY4EIK3_9BACI|nr:hypothetical protein [Halobacillus salinarum]UOQ43969.1 hypothetical protein MUN89_19195 [Halobacillus salinarum]